MPRTKKIDRTKIFNIAKFIWAVIIFYLWFKLFVPSTIKEDYISENMYEWMEVSVADELDENFKDELWKHDAPSDMPEYFENDEEEYVNLFQNICSTNSSFCSKLLFNGYYSSKDKYMYLASAVYILRFIENNIQIGLPIDDALNTIIINDSSNTRRWYATWDTVTLNLWTVSSYAEFMELVSHELWHIVDLWVVRWYALQKDFNYTEFWQSVFSQDDPSLSYYAISWDSENIRKADATVPDFCSSYAMSDPFEDFAECHNLYLNHNSIFKLRAQQNAAMRQKYNFFANLYGWKYLFNAKSDILTYGNMPNNRPWDTTKM